MPWRDTQSSRLRHLFYDGFSALDLAEPLVSFDESARAEEVKEFMIEKNFDLVGIRQKGLVEGYVRRDELTSGLCREHFQPFTPDDDLVPDTANLTEVVKSLAINQQCFVTILDRVGAIITLTDLEKPPMRMFLFGMITLGEMLMTELIRKRYSDGSWQALLSEQRLAKAMQLQADRDRRGQSADLIDCLQYGDKGWILSYDEEFRKAVNQASRREARKAIKEMETLRNNLAHTQEIIPSGWQRIVIACSRLETNLETFAEGFKFLDQSKAGR